MSTEAPPEHPHDHPHTDPGDGRQECQLCGKYIRPATHSCKGVPVTEAALQRYRDAQEELRGWAGL